MSTLDAGEMLSELSEAFRTQDLDRLLRQFSGRPDATYAGSEAGELATGADDMRELFAAVLGRAERYAFDFGPPVLSTAGDAVGLIADGTAVETSPDGACARFPYRISGVLVREAGRWVWLLLHGAEPAPAPAGS